MNNQTHLDSAVAKAARRLLPFLTVMLILAFLDRANIGFAKKAFQADTGLSDAAYAFGAGIFFIGYALFEVPSNIILHRVGARIWLARIMVSWGIISTAMMFAHTEYLFYTLRFLLGVCEAGFYPGALLYLTYWFPLKQRTRAIGLFYLGVPLSLVFGSPLSGWLLTHHDMFGLQNWQWMFLVQGGATILIGVVAFFYLIDRPADARWLTQPEREALTGAIASEERAKAHVISHSAFSVLKDVRVWLFIGIYFLLQVGTAPLTFYFPSLFAKIASGGEIGLLIGTLLALPWVCSVVATRYFTVLADRLDAHRRICMAMILCGTLALAMIGLTENPTVMLIAACIAVPGLTASQPVFWSLPTRYLSGIGAASGIAFIVSIGNLGAFLSPQTKNWVDAASGNEQSGFYVLALLCGGAVLLLWLTKSSVRGASPLATGGIRR
ncbi:MFS transporter [Mesorhizobium sp. RP14(2022)]|uniref:MFS transporter n=1 Tax=Mesorhizobium liriopis TaxID=2953882 RepID=A0ABT1CBZ5_9HYPH|nr:MFS transporter [Mesorhizobium liriopis]MCO6052346.1 MFS transporter [Mesorhizobium liriopis]